MDFPVTLCFCDCPCENGCAVLLSALFRLPVTLCFCDCLRGDGCAVLLSVLFRLPVTLCFCDCPCENGCAVLLSVLFRLPFTRNLMFLRLLMRGRLRRSPECSLPLAVYPQLYIFVTVCTVRARVRLRGCSKKMISAAVRSQCRAVRQPKAGGARRQGPA